MPENNQKTGEANFKTAVFQEYLILINNNWHQFVLFDLFVLFVVKNYELQVRVVSVVRG